MKKNKMMRLASGLLVAVLLTTSMISGTYAKYVTEASGSDTARVAKWGITMNSNGSDTFKASYDSTDITVESEDKVTDVVAPGTTNTAIYKITGTPETDYEVTFTGTATSDIYLGKGNYYYVGDPTDDITYVGMNKTVVSGAEYYPITYTLKIETANGSPTNFESGTVYSYNTLEAAMIGLNSCKAKFESNEECDIQVTFGWKWAFTGQDDVADTILGDLMANNEDLGVDEGADYSLKVAYTINMTATQID